MPNANAPCICPSCNGRGYYVTALMTAPDDLFRYPCPVCRGTGSVLWPEKSYADHDRQRPKGPVAGPGGQQAQAETKPQAADGT